MNTIKLGGFGAIASTVLSWPASVNVSKRRLQSQVDWRDRPIASSLVGTPGARPQDLEFTNF